VRKLPGPPRAPRQAQEGQAMSAALALPRRGRGRLRPEAQRRYEADLAAFCDAIREIRSRLDFKVSSRGWCYILEEHGLGKGDFDAAERLIVDCRKSGALPLAICADDGARKAANLEAIGENTPEDEAAAIVETVHWRHELYTPVSFWDDQEHYVEMAVERVDLKSLFSGHCETYFVPLTNARGWNDLNSRAAMMQRFAEWEAKGKQCVLLYCGDFDPSGLNISEFLSSNMADIRAVGWSPDNLIIDRFGLNFDFIEAEGLTWIGGLSTGNPRTPNLEDPRHPDHAKPYVQDYLRRYGARKCEANALVVRPEAGRELCRQAIMRYLPEDATEPYEASLAPLREEVRLEVVRLLAEGRAP
jgi:hypothetical protein